MWEVTLMCRQYGKLQMVTVWVSAPDRQAAKQRALDESNMDSPEVIHCTPVLSVHKR